MSMKCERGEEVPHAYKVLHHELVEGLRRVGHINLPWSIPEIGLRARGISDCHYGAGGRVPSL